MKKKGANVMKSKRLVMITASLISVTALLLSAGLSLLQSAAFEATMDQVDIDSVLESIDESIQSEVDDNVIGEDIMEEATEDQPDVAPPQSSNTTAPETENSQVQEETPVVEDVTPKYDYPDFEYNIVDAKDLHYCGCEQDNPYTAHYDLLRGVTIDVYSHKTGELVGQLTLESEEIENYISKLVAEEFNPWAQTFEPNSNEEAVNLPMGDYRIEVYSGTWFSYTYGNNTMFELTQCTLTFYGGEKMTGYIDYLISDYIAQIEAGNIEKPNPENAVSKLEFSGLEGYWDGYYHEILKQWIKGAGRFTERFPYLEN